MSEGKSGQNSVYGTLRLESGLKPTLIVTGTVDMHRDSRRQCQQKPTRKKKRHFRPFRNRYQDLLGCEARVPGRHVMGSSPPRLFLLLQSKEGPKS
ncbi:hypothetical protein PGTUg99_012474 [Puccinia graminis f. sp. tritici]|uniref:Uncharacterized protein n=1 Tax=Puccinia graminis f. sp. tritici TaxID=56615 RepID=A0A5B0RPI6_PUCGR|nr:hypothetical protein PGTUg99_012474 [Puccinia graminis f. sp. tritici]